MGAPSKGAAAKTEVITVRMTKAEREALEQRAKTPALALRALMKANGIGGEK
jgi:hypothetical protein